MRDQHLSGTLVAPNVWCFGTAYLNFFVLRQAEELILIDAGYPNHLQQVDQWLQREGLSWSNFKHILLTHAHLDHIGIVNQVARRSGAPVYLHPDDGKLARQGLGMPPIGIFKNLHRSHIRKMVFGSFLKDGVLKTKSFRQWKPITDGQSLNEVPGAPMVLHVPGHSPGEVMFWFADLDLLFTGDAMITLDLYSGRELSRPVVVGKGISHDPVQALESVQALAQKAPAALLHKTQTLLSGHGLAWRGRLQDAIHDIQAI